YILRASSGVRWLIAEPAHLPFDRTLCLLSLSRVTLCSMPSDFLREETYFMKLNQRKRRVVITLVVLLVLCAALALISQHAFAQKRRPILILTKNGEVVVRIIGPKGATDVHVVWGGPG